MLFTRKEDYGVLLMKRLAQNYNARGWVSLREISRDYNLPLPFLKQLMRDLKRAKLVISKEGKDGGYKLARDPKNISLGEILRAIQGPLAVTYCYSEDTAIDCGKENICPSKDLLQKIGEEFILKLDKIKLT